MSSVTNSTTSGLIEVTPGSADTTERLVGDMDVTITVSGGAVDISVNLWASMDQFGAYKYAVARIRRDNASGAIVASTDFGGTNFDPDDSGGHQRQWATSFTDASPTTGRYVVTLQATPNAARVYTDTHSITITSPSTATLLPIPVGSVTTAGLAPSASYARNLPVPVGTVAAAGAAPTVRAVPRFAAYVADDNASQALTVAVEMAAYLTADVNATAPPTDIADYLDLLRVSPVMPTPTLDSNGRPT